MDIKELIVVRGAGDLATGTICRLHRCGFRLLVLETARPRAIRRTVSLSEAVYEGSQTVEGTTCVLTDKIADCSALWQAGTVPLLVDPEGECIHHLHPLGIVDAILLKQRCRAQIDQAPITIGLGPGFTAGKDVHAVIETARGHDLGRVLYEGSARPNTGVPGSIDGFTRERVIYAAETGILTVIRDIGARVEQGELIARIGDAPVLAPITGRVRGMLRPGYEVPRGMKIADIDPRIDEPDNCRSVSDKARAVSGGVVEALLFLRRQLKTHLDIS